MLTIATGTWYYTNLHANYRRCNPLLSKLTCSKIGDEIIISFTICNNPHNPITLIWTQMLASTMVAVKNVNIIATCSIAVMQCCEIIWIIMMLLVFEWIIIGNRWNVRDSWRIPPLQGILCCECWALQPSMTSIRPLSRWIGKLTRRTWLHGCISSKMPLTCFSLAGLLFSSRSLSATILVACMEGERESVCACVHVSVISLLLSYSCLITEFADHISKT